MKTAGKKVNECTYVWVMMDYAHDHCAVNDDAVNGPYHNRHHHLSDRLCDAHNIPAIVVVLSLNNQHEHNVNQYVNWLTIQRPELHFSMTQNTRNSSHVTVLSAQFMMYFSKKKIEQKKKSSIRFQTKLI